MSPESAAPVEDRPRPQRGDELDLRIESLAFGGEGVARLGDGGYVVFVAGAIPGDRVRAVVHKRKRSYAHARTLEVLEPSPERIAAVADHPGVPWQVLPYERQLQIKREQVDEALRRIGRLDGFDLQDIVPAVEQWRYRNKLEYSFGVVPTDEGGEQLVCGFHVPAGANRVAQIEDCMLASERGNLAREVALRWCREQGLTSWERGGGRRAPGSEDGHEPAGRAHGERRERIAPAPDGRARLRNLVVREGRHTGKLQIRIVTTDGELDAGSLAQALSRALGDSLAGVLWTRSQRPAETTAGGETELVWGEAALPERLGELDLLISPEAFLQTNTEMAELLYGVVADFAALEGWERVYDLYCGIGAIALTLAPARGRAVEDRARRRGRRGRDRERAPQRDHQRALLRRRRTPRPRRAPRARRSPRPRRRRPSPGGPVEEGRPPHHRGCARRIVYVSCNPTTLAPNAAAAGEAGWALRKVTPGRHVPADPAHRVRRAASSVATAQPQAPGQGSACAP